MIDGIKHKRLCLYFVTLSCGYACAQIPKLQIPDIPIDIQSVWRGNRLLNGTFEEGLDGWILRMGASHPGDIIRSKVQIDDNISHSGFNSLKLSGDQDTTYWYAVESDSMAVREGSRYRLRGWIKIEDVRREGDQYLNCNLYVQFLDTQGKVIKISGSPVRSTRRMLGTQEWTQVERIVRAPLGSIEARVGCVLSCTGTAWFDDVEFSEGDTIAWRKKETEHFTYFYKKGKPPDTTLAMNDAYAAALEGILEVKLSTTIRYYKYESQTQKTSITGMPSRSHHESNDIHAITWDQRHDLVHVLMNQVGQSTPLLEEGIVLYALSVLLNEDVHRSAKSMLISDSLLPIQKLIVPEAFNRAPMNMTHAHAGSFVGFLVEQYGMDTFKKLYPYPIMENIQQKLPKRFLSLYGLNLDEAEMVWKDYLKASLENPAAGK